jgi:hypothetical protein
LVPEREAQATLASLSKNDPFDRVDSELLFPGTSKYWKIHGYDAPGDRAAKHKASSIRVSSALTAQ